MLDTLNGSTRVHFIVGDPIAQVKSPAGMTQAYLARGHNAYVLPAHVAPADLSVWLAGVGRAQNVDGIIATVPHKFACFELCASSSERASFLRAANVMRRNPDGSWHGDMLDGLACVQAMQEAAQGRADALAGQRALLVGAGGAGSAIGHALLLAGVRELAVHDPDAQRRNTLIDRLGGLQLAPVVAGSADASGYGVVVNATPVGMAEGDPYPLQVNTLQSDATVACVITVPAVTPLIAAARARGCACMTGSDMFGRVRDLMVDFFVGAGHASR